MKYNQLNRAIITLIIIFMPMHSMLFDVIIPSRIDNLWRDFLLLFAFFLILKKKKGKINLGKYGTLILIMFCITMIYVSTTDRLVFALNLARTYCMPMLIYFYLINIKLEQKDVDYFKDLTVKIGVILAVWGIFQAFVLGDSFLVKLGYPSSGDHLRSNGFYISGFFGIQRVTSTLVYPNVCGLYFGIIILLLSTMLDKKKIYIYYMFIMAFGLITTFSRSAILGTFLGFVLLHRKKIVNIRIKPKYIVMAILAVFLGLLLDQYVLDARVLRMIERSITSTMSMTDSSATKHLEDLVLPISEIVNNPLGLGFGYNGPNVLSTYGEANLVESSVYLLAYDFGILGAVIFLIPYIAEIFRSRGKSDIYSLSGAVCLLVLVTYLLLPNIQNYEIIFFTYFFIAFCNKNITTRKTRSAVDNG